jgi:hypothetical protein
MNIVDNIKRRLERSIREDLMVGVEDSILNLTPEQKEFLVGELMVAGLMGGAISLEEQEKSMRFRSPIPYFNLGK